jgi:hypothetical protein
MFIYNHLDQYTDVYSPSLIDVRIAKAEGYLAPLLSHQRVEFIILRFLHGRDSVGVGGITLLGVLARPAPAPSPSAYFLQTRERKSDITFASI